MRENNWKVCFFCLFFLFLSFSPLSFAKDDISTNPELRTPGKSQWVADELIVKFKDNVTSEKIREINEKHQTAALSKSPRGKFMRLRVPQGKSVEDLIAAYSKDPNVEYAEPNYLVQALFVPNDTYYNLQWHLDNNTFGGIHMQSAWDIQKGNTGVIVAVIDTGIAYEDYGTKFKKAPDLANTNFVPGYNFVTNTTHANDDNSHGTHVTGTIAQSTNNGLGTSGIAFNTSMMPVKVLDKNGSGSTANVANGIYFAADHGAKVINLSLGSSSDSTTLRNAMAYAYSKGVTSVCAAGNEFQQGNPASYPAAYDAYCIAVGATRFDETRSYYSNTGSYLDIAAPGGDTNVDQNNDGYGDGVLQQTFNPSTKNTKDFGYWFFQGTSMATPHVVGVAALLIANGVSGPDNVRAALQSTAEDKGAAGWDTEYGWGLVDAQAALNFSAPKTHDVAITNISSPSSALQGDSIAVTVHTVNQGNFSESYTVTLTDTTDSVTIGSQVVSLPAGGEADLNFSWDTTSSSLGIHTLQAQAATVSGETDTADNTNTTTITLSVLVHDVAVIAVDAPSSAAQNTIVNIPVTVENQGTFAETTTVALNDETSGALIGSQNVSLNAGQSAIISFSWNTTGATLGDHNLKASASVVAGETDTIDNAINATVNIQAVSSVIHVSDISMGLSSRAAGQKNIFIKANATITIVDQSGNPISGATVAGSWSGATSDIDSALTDVSGKVVVSSDEVKNPASGTRYTFTVTGVNKPGVSYDSSANVETSDSIIKP